MLLLLISVRGSASIATRETSRLPGNLTAARLQHEFAFAIDIAPACNGNFLFRAVTSTIVQMPYSGRWTVIFFMISGLVLAGCQVETQPQDVGHFSTNRAATQDLAVYDGIYSLYNEDSDKTPGPLLESLHLTKGQVVGFEIGDDHLPYAIAGPHRVALQPGKYRWQMTPDAGQTDWAKTDTVVLEVVVAIGVVALIVVSAVVAVKSF